MAIYDKDGKQLSPCICSWARFALDYKSSKPKNSKRCSSEYWDKTIDKVGAGLPKGRIRKAKISYPPWD